MSSEIKERLKTTSEACLKCYEAWSGNEKDGKAREALQYAIHELRKVASRLEIDLAVSERNQMTQNPIPIPPHRDAKKGRPVERMSGDNDGNTQKPSAPSAPQASSAASNNDGPKFEIQKRPRRTAPKPAGGEE